MGSSFTIYIEGHLWQKTTKTEEYVLSIDRIEDLAKQQVQRFDWPSFEQNRIRPIYALEEIYVKNDGTGTIPFEIDVKKRIVYTCIRSWSGMNR